MVFQDLALWPNLSAIENVRLGLAGTSLSRLEAATRAEESLQRCGIGSLSNRLPNTLSGGEQQRVALARAFTNDPKVLFADEPTGNLDASTGHTIIDLMVELNRAAGTTLVLVTHDPELAQRARRTIRLRDGAVVEDSAA